MAPDNDDTRPRCPCEGGYCTDPACDWPDGGDSDGLPRDWLEGVTLDYYWVMDPGTLQGPFDAPPVRR